MTKFTSGNIAIQERREEVEMSVVAHWSGIFQIQVECDFFEDCVRFEARDADNIVAFSKNEWAQENVNQPAFFGPFTFFHGTFTASRTDEANADAWTFDIEKFAAAWEAAKSA